MQVHKLNPRDLQHCYRNTNYFDFDGRRCVAKERKEIELVTDIVTIANNNAIRGKWTVGRVLQVYPGSDGRVRNVKVKTATGEYNRPVTKIAVIYPVEGYD